MQVSLFHAKSVSPSGGGPRLTLHQYFGRLSNPPNIGWALLPRRLIESEDEGLRRFCGNLTRVQECYARSGYDLRKCAESTELLEHLSTDDATAADRNAGRVFLAEHSPEHFHADLELSAAEAAAVEELRDSGFAVLRGAVSPAHLELLEVKMAADLPQMLAAHEAKYGHPAFQWHYGHHQQDPPRESRWVFGDVFANQAVARVAKALLGESCWTDGLTGNTNLPGSHQQPLHRDRDHDSQPGRCVIVNIPTRDVSSAEGNGPIELWPGSHRERRAAELVESVRAGDEPPLLMGAALSDEQMRGTVHPAIADQRRAFAPPVLCNLRQGDILVRDAKLWHAGTRNIADQPRFMLALVINQQRSDSSPVFAMGRGSEPEIGPGSRLVDIGPAVEFLPDEVVAARALQDFVARDRSSRYDGSGPLPRDAPRL